MRRYEELSEIFSEKDNYAQSRELLKEVSFLVLWHLGSAESALPCFRTYEEADWFRIPELLLIGL